MSSCEAVASTRVRVYRRLPDVLAAQKGTIEVLHTLRPLIVVMAGADLFDPYKD